MRIARRLRLLGGDDRGAIGVLIAVLVAGGVLLGTGALVIDVGQIYQNRAELQNGADAAALAIAQQCGQQGTCPATASGTAQTFTNANASALTSHTNGVVAVCGSGSGLDPCSDYPSLFGTGLTACPADPTGLPAGAGFVDVATSTKLPTGSTLLPPVFARTLVGNSTYDGTNVKACAQAEWGAPAGLAVTFSTCEFNIATQNGTQNIWQPTPPWSDKSSSPWPPSSYDISFTLHSGSSGQDATCDGPASQDEPGAFGWTSGAKLDCVTVVSPDGTYGADTGNAPGDCQAALQTAQASGVPVSVPIYSTVSGQGINAVYSLAGYALLVVTGFYVPGSNGYPGYSASDWLNPLLLCGPPDTCIDGFFVSGLTKSPTPSVNVYAKLTG